MNLTDLTTELQARADGPAAGPALPAVHRLAGVRHRIQVRRRRQAAAATGVVAAAVAAVLLGPGLVGLDPDHARPAPPAVVVPEPADDMVFAADRDGDPKVADRVSSPGQLDLVLRFTPTDTNLAMSDFCFLPVRLPVAERSTSEVKISVNGHPLIGDECAGDDRAGSSWMSFSDSDPELNRARWADLDVVPGQESVLRMRTSAAVAERIEVEHLRLGAAFYVMSGPREFKDGFALKEQIEQDGHRYRLAQMKTGPGRTGGSGLTLAVPDQPYPVLLSAGSSDGLDDGPDRELKIVVDGEEVTGSTGGGVMLNEATPTAGAHTVELRMGSGLSGTMMLAYYVRID